MKTPIHFAHTQYYNKEWKFITTYLKLKRRLALQAFSILSIFAFFKKGIINTQSILLPLLLFIVHNTAVAKPLEFDENLYSICIITIDDDSLIFQTFNKKIPSKYQKEIYEALMFFPELDSTEIEFREQPISTTLNTRPSILSLLTRKPNHRKYIIRINTSKKDSIIAYRDVPHDARVGLLSHELCHILDYENRNLSGIIKRLIMYMFPKSKEKFEKEIDFWTIHKGLWYQLYNWSSFVLNDSNASNNYKQFKRNIYLEPEEICWLNFQSTVCCRRSHFKTSKQRHSKWSEMDVNSILALICCY